MELTCPKCGRVLKYAKERPLFCSYCGSALPAVQAVTEGIIAAPSPTLSFQEKPRPSVAIAPETVGGYRLLHKLGEGGMGTVYEAEDQVSGRRVALKVIAPEYAESPEAVERFRQEGRIASMVTHPRCVFVLAVDEEAGRPYIVMELMPGATLQDLVRRQGPLPLEEAIAKILDVIEGLQAAHRLEVIHRDVKPSNCFLEADGRVKVGDFGLAKSLVQAGTLTRTGAFVGTLFFASPEQIRGEPVDLRTDVYSVAATLYFLLTGQAPFQGGDPAAALARIVSDPAPSLRNLRPGLSTALDRVIARGLERDLDKRWPDLEAFRQALLALMPAPLTREAIPRRLAAGLLDSILLWAASHFFLILLDLFFADNGLRQDFLGRMMGPLLGLALAVAYFTVLEQYAGASLGKKVLRLVVCPVEGEDPPTGESALARSLIFCGILGLGPIVAALVVWLATDPSSQADLTQSAALVLWGWFAVGCVLICSTMRQANGFRGLHEVLSGTRVLQLPWPKKPQVLTQTGPWLLYFLTTRRLDQQLPQRNQFPERVGGFTIRGVLKWTAQDRILLGEDASLGRRVFLWLRPASEPPLEQARRDVDRRTRLRWLGCGRLGDWQWDALLAPLGCPLPELIHSEGPMSWLEVRTLLAELAAELAASMKDGTLPRAVTLVQVWVQPNGQAQLADTALAEGPATETLTAGADPSLSLLREAALLTLEGQTRTLQEQHLPMRGRLPAAARNLLQRLLGAVPAYRSSADFLADLQAGDGQLPGT